jgi:hypothetical protein
MVAGLAWVATVVSAMFSVLVLARYAHRRQPAYLVWGLALACFALGSGAEAIARLSGWSPTSVKVFYIFGAGMTAGLLGVGTLLLTAPPIGRIALLAALVGALLIAVQTAAASVNLSELPTEGFKALDRPVRLQAVVILMNSLGTLAVLLPTLRSAVRAARARERWSRTSSLLLIALGVLIVATGHSLAGLLRLAPAAAISVVNAVGVTVMFIGFMLPSVEA